MDTNKMREEFEAWLPSAWSRETYIDDDGDLLYVEDWVQGAWVGWQASRAALVVDLPSESCVRLNDYTPYEAVEACERAIEAQGLKVAP